MLSACARFPSVYLINDSGALLEILRADGDGDTRTSERIKGWFFGYVGIADGAGRAIMYRWPQRPAWFEAKSQGCVYRYALPPTSTSFDSSAVVQVGPDRRLYLISQNVWGDPREAYNGPIFDIPAQPDGFEVEPTVSCAARSRNRS